MLLQFLPGTFFPTLTSIATLCYVNNQSWLLRTLGSGYEGLGISNFSLDWSTIGYNGPLFTPWHAQLNWFAGIMGAVWVAMPIMLAINFWSVRLCVSADLKICGVADQMVVETGMQESFPRQRRLTCTTQRSSRSTS